MGTVTARLELANDAEAASVDYAVTSEPRPFGGVWLPRSKRWELYWADDFDGGLAPEWGVYNNSTYGEANNTEHRYWADNIVVSAGTAKFVAEQVDPDSNGGKRFRSGALGSREGGTYFPRELYAESRMRVPHGQGLWPAFWLRHRAGSRFAEPDIMESFHSQRPGKADHALHIEGQYNIVKTSAAFEPVTDTPGWHVWGLAIHETRDAVVFRWFLDGAQTARREQPKGAWWTEHPNPLLWDIALTFQISGTRIGHPEDPLGYSRYLDRCLSGDTAPSCRQAVDGQPLRRAGIGQSDPIDDVWEVDYVRVWMVV